MEKIGIEQFRHQEKMISPEAYSNFLHQRSKASAEASAFASLFRINSGASRVSSFQYRIA